MNHAGRQAMTFINEILIDDWLYEYDILVIQCRRMCKLFDRIGDVGIICCE